MQTEVMSIRMLRALFFVLGFFLYAGISYAAEKGAIRVLCYNIHHGVGVDGKLDLKRIAKVIKDASPDIVSLQEVDNGTKRTKGVDQAKELADLTGMKFTYGASMDFQGGEYGNAVLTRFDISGKKVVPLPGEPRSALFATLKLPENQYTVNELLFIAAHLDLSAKARLRSVELIEAQFDAMPDQVAILAGDLNATPRSQVMKAFGGNWTNTVHDNAFLTAPSGKPAYHIDHVLFRPSDAFKVIEAKVLKEKVASDHRPVLVVWELKPRGS